MTREVIVTFLTPERFAASPQVGLVIRETWHGFARFATWPTMTERTDDEAKTIAGAWCPAALPDGVVKGGAGPVDLLVADVDDCGPDGFDRSVEALAEYRGVVVTSCNATAVDTRHRIILLCDRTLTAEEFPLAWRKLQRTLATAGIKLDEKCKNANRLYYSPVQKRGGIFMARHLVGAPVAVDALLAAAREDEEREARARAAQRAKPIQHRTGTSTEYARRALAKAAEAVATAAEGSRNDTLNKEAYSLSRLPELTAAEIWDALGDAADRAGLPRHEATKTIASALRARRGAA